MVTAIPCTHLVKILRNFEEQKKNINLMENTTSNKLQIFMIFLFVKKTYYDDGHLHVSG